MVLPIGTTHIIIKGKLGTDFATNDSIQISTTPSDDWTIVRGETSGQTISPSPASLLTGPTMIVRSASLTVSVSAMPPAQDVIAGASQFEFARYIFDASQSSEDIRITSIPLRYDTTGSRNDLTNCRLYDGTEILNTGSNIKNPQVGETVNATNFTFDNAGFIVPKGTTKSVSLKCDVVSNASDTYEWGMGNDQQISYEGASGVLSGQTVAETLVASNGQTMTAATSGSYTVTTDPSLRYALAQAGDTNVTIAAFRFTAGIREAIDLKKIVFELGNTSDNSSADLQNEKASIWNGVTKIGEVQFGGASPDSSIVTLITPVHIERDETVTLTIKGDLSKHNSIEGTPGALLTINYDGDDNGIDGNYATGSDSGVTIAGTSSDVSTNGIRIFRTVPTITDVTNTDILMAGTELYKISISADDGRDIGIRSLAFNITETDAVTSQYQLIGPNGAVNNSPVNISGGIVRIEFDSNHLDRIVPEGTSKTYRLVANTITGLTPSGTETVSIRLRADTAFPTGITGLMGTVTEVESGGATEDNFVWTPFSATIPEATASINAVDDWTNGYGVAGFPGIGQNFPSHTFSH